MISTLMADHFIGVNKKVEIGSGAFREVDDIMLTCYACYFIAQNGDSRKPQGGRNPAETLNGLLLVEQRTR